MSDHAPAHTDHAHAAGHDDPMSHVPPGSIWPLIVTMGLTVIPFGVLSLLGALRGTAFMGPLQDPKVGLGLIAAGGVVFLTCLMAWASQIIKEKVISHDVVQQQKDLQMFLLLFLCGELAAFGAVFGYFYHRQLFQPGFGPAHGMHFGGPMVAYATFMLLSSSVTCEIAHHMLSAHRIGMAKLFFALTILLGVAFLGMQGYEWGELLQKGFIPTHMPDVPASAFAALFYTGTGFHGLHVAIGLVMLFMVLFRLEVGHFRGKRHFAAVAASWYWHFVDIVWVILFITIYVVG